MSVRATESELYKIVEHINSNIPEEYDKLGLRAAYGQTGVSTHNDSYDSSGLMTKGEVRIWLRGFQDGMALGRKLEKNDAEMLIKKAQDMGSI